jgi:hypothetical protein
VIRTATEILARERELDAIRDSLRTIATAGGALVLEGAPGIGKTNADCRLDIPGATFVDAATIYSEDGYDPETMPLQSRHTRSRRGHRDRLPGSRQLDPRRLAPDPSDPSRSRAVCSARGRPGESPAAPIVHTARQRR